jgi:hypothetical protein
VIQFTWWVYERVTTTAYLPGHKQKMESCLMRDRRNEPQPRSALGFFAEEFDVGWAFFYRGALAALDLFADLLDDVGIG